MHRNNSEENITSQQMDEEYQYLNLMKKIINEGVKKPNRTGTPTRSIFGNTMRFTLYSLGEYGPQRDEEGLVYDNVLPLLTTKEMTYRLIVEELLWFMRGSTDAKELDAKKVRIWNPNSSRKFLDSVGLQAYREGDIGPGYGFQWRHFGAEYRGCDADYTGQGVDQLENVRQSLLNDPYSRRHIISAWNPPDLKKTALPPCHILCQFNVDPVVPEDPDGEKYLDCSVYQRSADVPLGVPFNIASYATLTHILAGMTRMIPRHLVYTTGDTHIYENQLEACQEQLSREPLGFPCLLIKPKEKFEDYKWKHFKLLDYNFHPTIKYEFST